MYICIRCNSYKGIETCPKCGEPYCVFCGGTLEDEPDEPCDHNPTVRDGDLASALFGDLASTLRSRINAGCLGAALQGVE